MKAFFSIWILLVPILLSACQGWQKADEDARRVALVTSQRVATMQKELERKIAAERRFYKAQLDTIEKSQTRFDQTALMRNAAVTAINLSGEFIRNQSNITAEEISSKVLSSSTNLLAEFRMIGEKRQEQRATAEKSIRELQLLKDQYETLNKTLVRLSIPPSKENQLAQFAVFIKSVADDFERLKKESTNSAGSNP
jgi:flagellar capping protein FliD